MSTFNCLSQSTNIFGKHFLQASAGTGKTFAIEHLYVRLLIEDDNPLTVEQILTVTFTKAATRELKARIRTNIENVLNILKKDDISNIPAMYDYLKPVFLKKEKAVKILRENLSMFDRAEIFTIHGFCFRMLSLYAFDSKTLFNAEKIRQKEIIKSIVMDYFRYSIEESYGSAQVAVILKKYRDPNALIKKFCNFSLKNKNKFPTYNDYWIQFNEALSKCDDYDISLETLLSDYDALESSYKKEKKEERYLYENQFSLLLKILKQKNASFFEFDQILKTGLSFFEFISDANRKKKKTELTISSFHFLEFVKNNLYPIVLQALDEDRIFYNLSIDIQERVKKVLKEDDIFLPDDILIKMKEALSYEAFKQKASQKYQAVIIDEFQDTDAIQWDIFQTLFINNNLKAFYLVGDPKQAIYSFRNADLYTYLSASNHFETISFLDVNFRSSPKLLEGLNYIFSKEFSGEWLKLPKLQKSLPYLKIKAGRDDSFDFKDSNLPLHFFVGMETEEIKFRAYQLEEELFFPFMAKEIIHLINNSHILPSDIAILVKDRYQAKRLKQFLQNCGIESFSRSHVSLADTLAAKSLKEFMQAVINHKDLNFIKIALGGPFIGLTDKEINENDLQEAFVIFGKLNEVFQKKGLACFFAEFYKAEFSCSVYDTMIRRDDLSFYLNALQLIDLLIEQETEKRFSSESLICFFDNLSLIDVEDDERINVKPPLENQAIQIMTIHMSKGLEFEVVFAFGLVSRMQGEEILDLNFIADYEEMKAEKLRSLYVAMTRAKKRLYIPIAILKSNTNQPSPIDLFFSEKYVDDKILFRLNMLKEKNLATYEILNKQDPLIFKRKLLDFSFKPSLIPPASFKKNFIYSFSFLSQNKNEETLISSQKEEIFFSSKRMPPGPDMGILVHRIFEKIFMKNNENFSDSFIQKIILEETKLYSFEPSDIFLLVQKTLSIPLFDKGFSLKDIKSENIHVETEFLFSWHADYMKGFMDLAFLHDGKYYLLDWKTNFLGDEISCYEKNCLEKEMEKHDYFLQAAIYTEALFRYLKIIDPRPFEEIFGGIFYFFLRGMESNSRGIYHFIPALKNVEEEIQRKICYVK